MSAPKVFLERNAYVPGMGAFGVMTIPDRNFECKTVEQDWEDNKPSLSCIPEGVYELVRGRYNRGGYECFELLNVEGRSLIKIHRGNTLHDLLGCIAPGEDYGWVWNSRVKQSRWAVIKSSVAFRRFMDAMEGVDRTTITITSVFHVGTVGFSSRSA